MWLEQHEQMTCTVHDGGGDEDEKDYGLISGGLMSQCNEPWDVFETSWRGSLSGQLISILINVSSCGRIPLLGGMLLEYIMSHELSIFIYAYIITVHKESDCRLEYIYSERFSFIRVKMTICQ